MTTFQHDTADSIVAHSQADQRSLRFVTEFNDRECHEYQSRRDRTLKMLDDAEARLRAGREQMLSANGA